MFEFYIGTKVIFGMGCSNHIDLILREKGWTNIAVIVDHNIINTGLVKKVMDIIENTCDFTIIKQCTISEPTYDFLDKLRISFEGRNIQAVIGIGGGSTLDTAKAIAVLTHNKRPAIEYRGFNKMTEPVLPIIAIPTTAGTGSEITPNASFIDLNEKRKMGINGEAVRPKYAILDAELTLSCPKMPTISAGIDSIVHAVEAYVAKKTNPMARMFAKEGFKNVFLNLSHVIKEPQNIQYREKVMYGAFLSGVALMNSGTGPAAAMSYPIGVHFKVPHGIGGGIFLPHVMRHNVENGYYDYSELYEAIEQGDVINRAENRARKFVEEIFELWKVLSIPSDLSQFGLNKDNIQSFINETMELKGALDQNPISFYEKEIEKTLNVLGSS